MKKLIVSIFSLLSFFVSQAQSTAMDFSRNDCDGNPVHLYSLLDSGYTVVLEYVMLPNCQPCITAGKGLSSIVEPFKTSHPGKVKILQIAYSNSYTCETIQAWKANNGFTHQVLIKGAEEVDYYGGMGMPTIVVVGPKDRSVYYKKQGYNLSENAKITTAINNSLAGLTGLETYRENLAKIFPNPATKQIQIESKFELNQAIIYNQTGQEISTQQLIGKSAGLDVSALDKGFFFVKLMYSNGNFSIHRIIKD
ncbi:MAG: T9SS type A sorting domain-containing protein [Bacteroidia bacterium]